MVFIIWKFFINCLYKHAAYKFSYLGWVVKRDKLHCFQLN